MNLFENKLTNQNLYTYNLIKTTSNENFHMFIKIIYEISFEKIIY